MATPGRVAVARAGVASAAVVTTAAAWCNRTSGARVPVAPVSALNIAVRISSSSKRVRNP